MVIGNRERRRAVAAGGIGWAGRGEEAGDNTRQATRKAKRANASR